MMRSPFAVLLLALQSLHAHAFNSSHNSTYTNPILPGFHPDPSCIFVPEWDDTLFCASSSFLAFPGIPIHASKDLQDWRLVSNVLTRSEQLPSLAVANKSTSGIWASTIRYHEGLFYITTTMVFDDQPYTNLSRWDNLIFTSTDPFNSSSWSDSVHFSFNGYDTSPFWDDDGMVYMVGSHTWELYPAINAVPINLTSGALLGDVVNLWNGTGGLAPEGPHIYRKNGWYYFMIAEGGTGINHMETVARSKSIDGPYEPNPANLVLTNANTTAYFQTGGHADLFQDAEGHWWGVALSSRSGPEYTVLPMGRETVLTPVTWDDGEWPVFTNISGQMNGWHLPPTQIIKGGEGPLITAPDHLDFAPGSELPPQLIHWRPPVEENYVVSPPGHPYSLQLESSVLNLTGYDGTSNEGDQGQGQTFVGRRQVDTFFTYSVNLDFTPEVLGDEAGVTLFLDQLHHFDLGKTFLPNTTNLSNTTNASTTLPILTPHLRYRSTSKLLTSTTATFLKETLTIPLPASYTSEITLEIKAFNLTHYSFSAGPAGHKSLMQTIAYAPAQGLSSGFTGSLVGAFASTNGRVGGEGCVAYLSSWEYVGQGQVILYVGEGGGGPMRPLKAISEVFFTHQSNFQESSSLSASTLR